RPPSSRGRSAGGTSPRLTIATDRAGAASFRVVGEDSLPRGTNVRRLRATTNPRPSDATHAPETGLRREAHAYSAAVGINKRETWTAHQAKVRPSSFIGLAPSRSARAGCAPRP